MKLFISYLECQIIKQSTIPTLLISTQTQPFLNTHHFQYLPINLIPLTTILHNSISLQFSIIQAQYIILTSLRQFNKHLAFQITYEQYHEIFSLSMPIQVYTNYQQWAFINTISTTYLDFEIAPFSLKFHLKQILPMDLNLKKNVEWELL